MIRVALALGIVLEAIEIVRRAPAWLLILVGLLVAYVVALVIAYFWWIAGGLAGLALWRFAGLSAPGRKFARHQAASWS